MAPLSEIYRPRSLADIAGHSKTVALLSRLESLNKLTGRAFWISGPSGLGKTTLARIIANSVADPFNIEELDAGGITPADLDRFRDTWATYGMDFSGGSKKGRALIVNEAHGLRKDTIRCLLVLLEEIPSHVVVVFTTTAKGQSDLFECKHDSGPLVDRCGKPIELKAEETEAMARRVMEIAQREGLDGQPLDAYKLLLARCGYSIRRALGEVESGAMLTA